MGLFDRFKKQPKEQEQSLNELESVLIKAAQQPAYRAEFYKRLLTDDLVVLTAGNEQPTSGTVEEGNTVSFISFQDGKIPVFTSTDRIFDKGIVKEQMSYMALKGEDLFINTKGATFVLNPYSDYGKELLPDEIQRVLDGTIFTQSHNEVVIEEDTDVQIGQPAEYPTEIVESLRIVFSGSSVVKKAYLGWIYDASSGLPPHYIFALEADGDVKEVVHQAGFTAKEHLSPEEIVDFIQIDVNDTNGLSAYFINQTTPFYEV